MRPGFGFLQFAVQATHAILSYFITRQRQGPRFETFQARNFAKVKTMPLEPMPTHDTRKLLEFRPWRFVPKVSP